MQPIEDRSIKKNMVLNAIKGIMGLLFPLITFPYISRVLGVENVGRYNFSNSVVSYFVLIAGLGISTYAIREGARVRKEQERISMFANQMFTINIYSTILAYLLLILCLAMIPKFIEYKSLLLVLSIQIAFKTIGVEWIYSIYEDYLYVTIRSIAFQILSLILLFIFVHTEKDLNMYAAITVISGVGANILNFYHARKYCKIKFTRNSEIKEHIKPILIMFAMAIMVTIYVSSDITMLGFFCDDYTVGIYSVSTKVYNIITSILSSVLVVSIPRLSALLGQERKNKFNEMATDIYSTLLTVVLPSIVGVIALRREIVFLISSEQYISATSSLVILCVALFFCLGAWFWGQCILIPVKREKDVFNITIVSAISNVLLNLVLIPLFKENAAAITTVVSEALSFIWCWKKGRKYVDISNTSSVFIKVLIGCALVYGVACGLRYFIHGRILFITISIVMCVTIYVLIEIVLKNKAIISILASIKREIKH